MKESGTGRSLRQTLLNWARPRAAVSAISLGSFFACGGSVVGKADSLDLLWQSPRGRALGGGAVGSQSPLGKRRAVKTLAWNKPRPCALKARFGRVFLFIVTASSQSGGDTGATLRWKRRSRLLMVGVPCPRTAGTRFAVRMLCRIAFREQGRRSICRRTGLAQTARSAARRQTCLSGICN